MDVDVAPIVEFTKLWLLGKEVPKESGKWHRKEKESKDKDKAKAKSYNQHNACSSKRNQNADSRYVDYHTSYCVAVGLLPFHAAYLEKQPPQPKIFDFLSESVNNQ